MSISTDAAERSGNDSLTKAIIAAAIEVHRILGPGLLESTYRECLCYELSEGGLKLQREPQIPMRYKNLAIENAFRPDIIVEGQVVVELKHVEKILAVHEAQLRTYLRLTRLTRGLLLNFNSTVLKNGIRRIELAKLS